MSIKVEPASFHSALKEIEPELLAKVPQPHVDHCCEGMSAAVAVQSNKGRGR